MIERCHDAAQIMEMANHPLVKPWLPPLTHAKMAEYVSDPRTLAFVGDGAGAIFEWSAPAVYECHIFFVPPCKGRKAIEAAASLSDIMLNRYGARMLWGQIRISNRHARWFSRQAGFVSLGIEDRPDGPREVFVMERANVA